MPDVDAIQIFLSAGQHTLERMRHGFAITCRHGIVDAVGIQRGVITAGSGVGRSGTASPEPLTIPWGDPGAVARAIAIAVARAQPRRCCAHPEPVWSSEVSRLYGRALDDLDPALAAIRRGLLRHVGSCRAAWPAWVPRDPMFARDVEAHPAAALALDQCDALLAARLGAHPDPSFL